MQGSTHGKAMISLLEVGITEVVAEEPETSMRTPSLGLARWQLKDLKPPKYNGNAVVHTANLLLLHSKYN